MLKHNQKTSSGKLDSYYQGWRAEVLAEYILSEIAFVVPVHVRSDVGADFFCTLFAKEERYLEPGKTFSIQVKAKGKEITLNSTNLNFLASLRIPHYLCIANRKNSSIEIYSCQQLLPLFIKFGNFSRENKTEGRFLIKLKPIKRYLKRNLINITKLVEKNDFSDLLKDEHVVKWNEKKKAKQIELEIGPQVFETSMETLKLNGDERKTISACLSDWINFDYFNINNFSACVYSPLARYFNKDNVLTTETISFNQENPETFVYTYTTTRLAILLEHLKRIGTNVNEINTLNQLIDLLSEKNKINIDNKNDIMPDWTKEWDARLRKAYSELSGKN